jgi:hypothetical protein
VGGLALVGTGTALWVGAYGTYQDSKNAATNEMRDALYDDYRSRELVAVSVGVVGAAAAGVGVWLWLTSDRADDGGATALVPQPVITPSFAGATWAGRF